LYAKSRNTDYTTVGVGTDSSRKNSGLFLILLVLYQSFLTCGNPIDYTAVEHITVASSNKEMLLIQLDNI